MLPGGLTVHRQGRTLMVIPPDKNTKVLSTAAYNGGYFTSPEAISNTTSLGGPAEWNSMGSSKSEQRLITEASLRKVDLDPLQTVAMGTAANMDNKAIRTLECGKTKVSVVITGGVEGNGGRAGDPAKWDELKRNEERKGTIVTILCIDGELTDSAMARAIITATEAKSRAMQENMARSLYSHGIATGSGTDQIAVVCRIRSDIKFTNAGKHTKLGELIGQCVFEALMETLDNHSEFNPHNQGNCIRRMLRFGVTLEEFGKQVRPPGNQRTHLDSLIRVSDDPHVRATVAAVIHIQDEIDMGMVPVDIGRQVGNRLIRELFLKDWDLDLVALGRMDEEGDLIENLTIALPSVSVKNVAVGRL